MPAPKTPTENGNAAGFVDVLFQKAEELTATYDRTVKARKANRESLRLLADQDLLTDEQFERLEELYPERDSVKRTPAERAAALEAQAKAIREKATAAK